MKPAEIFRKALLLIISVVFSIAIERLIWNVGDGDFPLYEAAILAAFLALISLLTHRQPITEDPDAPPHQHAWRLRYDGWQERLVVTCDTCGRNYKLARRINTTTTLYTIALAILLYLPQAFILHSRLIMWILLCHKVSALLVNRLRYRNLRRRAPLSLLSETDRIQVVSETTSACSLDKE